MTQPTSTSFEGAEGLTIAADRWGDPHDPPVVFLHGGGQTRHSWGGTAAAVARRGWSAWTIDARGHGESDWAGSGDYRLAAFGADVVAVLEQIGNRPAVVGASLGGLTGLYVLGRMSPGSARGLVLVDIVPDMERRGTDRIAAFMTANAATGFASLEEAADAVAAYNRHRSRPPSVEGLRKNLRERDGRWYWHWDPRFIAQDPELAPSELTDVELLMGCARAIREPMMLVRGRMSDVVTASGAAAFVDAIPGTQFVDVSDAGHMVAGDRNDAFTDAVVTFLRRLS